MDGNISNNMVTIVSVWNIYIVSKYIYCMEVNPFLPINSTQ